MKFSNAKTPFWQSVTIVTVLALCSMNYLVRFIPLAVGDYPQLSAADPAQLPSLRAWFEFSLTLALQVALSICLLLFVGIRELGRIALLGRGGSRLSIRSYVLIALWIAGTAMATSDLLMPWFPPDTRVGALPFAAKAPMAGFMSMMALLLAILCVINPALMQSSFDSTSKDGLI